MFICYHQLSNNLLVHIYGFQKVKHIETARKKKYIVKVNVNFQLVKRQIHCSSCS